MGVALREKALSDGRQSLYLDVYHSGRRSYEFLGLYLTKNRILNKETKELAENIRAKRHLELKNEEFGFEDAHKKKINLLDYIKKVKDDKIRYEGMRGGQNYQNTIKHLEDFTKKQGIQIGSINEKWVENFKQYLSTKMKETSANNIYARLKATLHRAVKEKIILKSPADNVKFFASPDVEKVFLSDDEVSKLGAAPCLKYPDTKKAFLFGCYTGLRYSDIKALSWGDIKGDKIHFRQRKTNGFEYMPLSKMALLILAQCRGENEFPMPEKPVFNIVGKSHISKYLKPWVKAAGITKKITFHCSRHTFATSLLTAGTDIYRVSNLLGHRSLHSTAIYAKVIDQKKIDAVNSIPEMRLGA